MKAWLVSVEFKNGGKEGVVFTDYGDAFDAYSGTCESGSSLVVAWCDTYGDTELSVSIDEIEL